MLQRLKRQEPQIEGPRERPYHPAVAATFENIARTHEERDQLAAENADLKKLLAAADRENDFVSGKLREVEANRDFYQRHYVALHSRLADLEIDVDNLRNRIAHAISEARREADAGGVKSGVREKGAGIVEHALEPTNLPEGEGFQSQTDHG